MDWHWLTRVVLVFGEIFMQVFSLPFLFYYKVFTKKNIVSPIKNEILMLSVNELLWKMQYKQIKSIEIVSSYINRIKEVNPLINAVVEDRFIAAMKEAELADKIRNESFDEINKKYPLLGIPFTVKESIGLKDYLQSSGLVKFSGKKATNDASIVKRLRTAGAIALLVSATSEFCNNLESHSPLHGRCRNPYDLRRNAGGSSSGEAALNGSGASLFGTGSDLCGSIRLPCLFNCVFGHKPTGGMVSTKGHFPNINNSPIDQFMQLGIITRFASDLELLLKICLNEKKKKYLKFDKVINVKTLKIFYINEMNIIPFSRRNKDIKNSLESVLNYFKSTGHQVIKFESQELKYVPEILLSIACYLNEIPSGMESYISDDLITKSRIAILPNSDTENTSLITEFFKNLLGLSQYSFSFLIHEFLVQNRENILFGKGPYWLQKKEKLKKDLLNILNEDVVIIMPSSNELAPFPNMILKNLGACLSTAFWNVVGFPATHIPIGLNAEGLPLGIQVIARPYNDRTCIAVATHLEQVFGGWRQPRIN